MSMVRLLLGSLQPSVNMPKNVNQKQKDQHEKSAAKEPTNSENGRNQLRKIENSRTEKHQAQKQIDNSR